MKYVLFACLYCYIALVSIAQAADRPIRILFVGGDWKSQLTGNSANPKDPPMRGHFVQQAVDQIAPGKFSFTFWTSYEFLQYGSTESLSSFDVLVAGDVFGQSVMPRLVKGVDDFVSHGGGLWYPDNHKAFSFNSKERSFDSVLPFEFVDFRPMGALEGEPPGKGQPIIWGLPNAPVGLKAVAVDHPIFKGIGLSSAPQLKAAHTGSVKLGATILATSREGSPIWISWEKGNGRSVVTGGLFTNDEQSEEFCSWPQIGQLYVNLFTWLGAKSTAGDVVLQPAEAAGNVQIDIDQKQSALSARHFSIHGQEDVVRGSDAEKKLYEDLNMAGAFARFDQMAIVKYTPKNANKYPKIESGIDLTKIDWSAYQKDALVSRMKDVTAINAIPIGLFWIPWNRDKYIPDPHQWLEYFRAALVAANGIPTTADYHDNVEFFEPGNEPNIENTIPAYINFLNVVGSAIHKEFPGVKIGFMGNYEWPYIEPVIKQAGQNLDWVSRHPYGQTGEACFYLQDKMQAYAKEVGQPHLKSIITEWDFWIYGEPAFDYLMQRWKPMADHAGDCLGTIQYRWNEYQEGGYLFGVRGVFDLDSKQGRLPADWPHPGRDQPITYRYDAFWLMRNCRGEQYDVKLDIPSFKNDEAARAYGIATSDGKHFNIVLYYGYPYQSLNEKKEFTSLKLRIKAKIPQSVKGRSLVISRGDARTRIVEPAKQITGNLLDLEIDVPSLSGVSLNIQ